MPRTISAAMLAHIQQEVTTLATCWRLTRRDGVIFRFTDHDRDLTISGDTYLAAVGYTRSAISSSADMTVDNVDLNGMFDDDSITVEDLRARKFDGAEVLILLVVWSDLTIVPGTLRRGYLGEVIHTPSGVFRTTLEGLARILNQTIGDLSSPGCPVDLGSTGIGKCNKVLTGFTVSGTVSSVVSGVQLNVTIAGTFPDGWFNFGVLTWTGGVNTGRSMEVKNWYESPEVVVLYLPTGLPASAGDTFTMVRGCDKTLDTCRDVFNNVVNFQGFPHLPGQDYVTARPVTP